MSPALWEFEGRWHVARHIRDHGGGPDGRFDGTAQFVRSEYGLSYTEIGRLYLGGAAPFRAERRYQWHLVDGRIDIRFNDGRPFHSLDPANAKARHWCDPDTYEVAYDFQTWPVWTSTWVVSGPRKAYEMTTTYTRNTD